MTQDRDAEIAARFGQMVREQRLASNLRQEDLALVTGVGRRFIGELEAGKHTCQLGKALRVAESLGIELPQIEPAQPDFPDYIEDDDDDVEDDGEGLRLHEYTRLHSKP